MSKGGVLGTLLPVLGGVAALSTGLGAAGIGPLAGLFSAGDAAGAAAGGADAALTAGGTAAAEDAALTAGTDIIPATGVGLDVGAGLPAATSLTGSALPAVTGDVGSVIDNAAVPAASGLDAALPAATSADIMSTIGPAFDSPAAAGVAASGGFADPLSAATGVASDASPLDVGAGGAGVGSDVGGTGGDFASSTGTPWWQNPRNLLAAAPLALFGLQRILNPSGLPPGGQAVQQAAQTSATNEGVLTGQGQQNMSYVNTGALPPGAQAAINAATNAGEAQVRSAFAASGVPPGSTMEAQDLAAVQQNAAAQKFAQQLQLLQAGNQQFQTGAQYGNQVGQLDYELMIAQIQQEQELEQALAGFSGAVASSGAFTGTA